MSSPQTSPAPDAGTNIMNSGKPKCGGGEEVGEYDLGLHVAGLCKFNMMRAIGRNDQRIFELMILPVLVMLFSILGAGFPVVAKKVSWVKVPTKVFFMCKHFGTGVLIATAFVHVCYSHAICFIHSAGMIERANLHNKLIVTPNGLW